MTSSRVKRHVERDYDAVAGDVDAHGEIATRRRVELIVSRSNGAPTGVLTGTLVTERDSHTYAKQTEHGLFIELDRGGWFDIRPTNRTEQDEGMWTDLVATKLDPADRHPDLPKL